MSRSARCALLGPVPEAAEEIWLVCHGYGQLASYFIRPFAALASDRRLIVAPEGLSRFYLEAGTGRVGASWMTKEDREAEMDDYLGFLDAVWRTVSAGRAEPEIPTLTVLGFSQGAATAARWAASGRAPVSRLVLWGGLLPADAGADRLRGCALTYVIGEQDRYLPAARVETEAEGVRRQGLAVDVVTYAGDHAIDPDALLGLVQG